MKLPCSLLLSALLMGSAASAFAAAPSLVGSVGAVTITLTRTGTVAGTVRKDVNGKVLTAAHGGGPTYSNEWSSKSATKSESDAEYVSKMVVQKYGNKEFLTDLVAHDILPPIGESANASIVGWSLVHVTPTDTDGEIPSTGESKFCAIHTSGATVDLSEIVSDLPSNGYTEAKSAKIVTKTNNNPPSSVTTITDTTSWKLSLGLAIQFDPSSDPEMTFQGIMTASSKLTNVGTGANLRQVEVVGAQKISGISGTGPVLDEEDEHTYPTVIEGSISIAAGKASVDLSRYFFKK